MFVMYVDGSDANLYALGGLTGKCETDMANETVADGVSDTSIRVTEDLADELFDRKRRGESYEDVIWRLVEKSNECGGDE
jgi:hypothetical protein